MQEVKHILKVLPIHVVNPQADVEDSIYNGEELESLIDTFGGVIVDRVIQRLDRPNNNTYIGRGKVIEVQKKLEEKEVDIVILNAMAKPGQIHELKKALQTVSPKIEVWDRIDLILSIFDKHATTVEAKLQIELAKMRYMGPRIYGMGHVLSRQGGGIGTTGIGETNTELMKRHWRSEMKKINDKIEKIVKNRAEQLERRKRAGFKTVSIVGYTNAGKSSLFNLLSGKANLTKNELFATLDSSIGKMYIPTLQSEVLITDTIGFIRKLPPHLISAFKSTLMESIYADILLHVIDVSDPEIHLKIHVVSEILHEIRVDQSNIIYVFNKTDLAPNINKEELIKQYGNFSPIFISVKNSQGVKEIQESIASRLEASGSKTLPINLNG